MSTQLGIVSVLSFFCWAIVHVRAAQFCRCLPSEACWPSTEAWNVFNLSIGGALIATRPPASPCHDPDYDQAACDVVKQKWSDVWWRADQPGALQSPFNEMHGNNTCLIGASRSVPCMQGTVPVYSVNVSKVIQVQYTVAFADKHHLRLVIKNTGHELTGRNTAPGSLGLWMHNLKDLIFIDNFRSGGSSQRSKQAAVKVGAGVQWEDLYKAAFEHGVTVVGAECTSVGAAGGYFQGSGHSLISPTFGLAADNVLEIEVVTAEGEFVVANSHQNQDLFWAMRGGGGGTFGIVISVTYATFPALDSLVSASYTFTSNSTTTLKSFLSQFISLSPILSDFGWGGKFIVTANSLSLNLLLLNKNLSFAEQTFEPLLSHAASLPDLTISNTAMQLFNSYYEWHLAIQCSGNKCGFPSGLSLIEASRLVPQSILQNISSALADSLIKFSQAGYGLVAVYVVGGGKVSIPQPNAVNPAWRKALLHVMVVALVSENSTTAAKKAEATRLTELSTDLLRNLTPGSGAYFNEADANEPDWQQSFFGSNYRSLKVIKDMVDPKGLLVCRHCVGSEEWDEDLNCKL